MSIVIERHQWEPELRYYVRSTSGATPICEIALKGDHWEVLFYRGATHPGPHVYFDYQRAERHVLRYVEPREAELAGELTPWAKVGYGMYAGTTSRLPGDTGNPVSEPSQPLAKRRTRRRYR